ncbi:CHC2 zinc finger domain-containing protein [Maridesulfovibrio ferrireducens]|uniref:CHC2 zinc finger domain-containing protein n=1 Tax=Maridesulfovibrio ferrireducens TaxID=246191 RepID=UPI001A1E550F|nr:CHC2 zinc finger domain-containing protein [Maridesulfovibrio ferrireducens]MBI9109982.1 hypothetical protein [Maridesulfovibrio ferrireducens]
MGKALEFLGTDGCAVALTSLIDVKKGQGTHDQWFCCPFHGSDKEPSAHYDSLQDVFFCFGCQVGGDLIKFYTDLQNMDETEGFLSFLKAFCPDRMGGSRQDAPAPRKAPVPVKNEWVPDAPYLPSEAWRKKADEIVRECAEELQTRPDLLAQLGEWGIDAETARKCLVGWNSKDRFYSVTSMGLPYEPAKRNPDRERKIWWPKGLVFASFRDGLPAKVKIRVEELLSADMPRYFQIYAGAVSDGQRSPYLIAGRHDALIWVIVETDRDAYLVWSACVGLPFPVGVMAVGAAGARPDSHATAILRRAVLILNGLDNDRAGRQFSHEFWREEFPFCRRWPVPPCYGKDIGDAVFPLSLREFSDWPLDSFSQMGFEPFYLDVRTWVEAGIPSHVVREVMPKTIAEQIEAEKIAPKSDEILQPVSLPVAAVSVAGPGSDVLLLSELMGRHKIGLQLGEGLSIVEPSSGWANKSELNWRAFTRISSLIFGESAQIDDLLDSLPDGLVTATTLLKPWISAGWKPVGSSK